MNIHLYPSSILSQSRMLKEGRSILEQRLATDVVILGIMEAGLSREEFVTDNFKIIRHPIAVPKFIKGKIGKLLQLIEYSGRSFVFMVLKKPTSINCHSLNVLAVGVLYKIMHRGVRLIYDAHELETERVGLSGFPKLISKLAEKTLIRFVDHLIVVCDPIRDWYRDVYSLSNVSVVRNIPNKQKMHTRDGILRQKHGIPEDDMVFIYQGVLSKARGVYDMLAAFQAVQSDRHIVFMGFGPAQDAIASAAKKYPNIHFQPAVKPGEIVAYTSGADVGLNFISGDICLSYQLSLPNKFFEYLYAGCCVLVSDNLTYLSELIESNGLGWSIQPDSDSLASRVMAISAEEVRSRRSRLAPYVENNYWELDQMNYKEAFGHV